MILKLLIKKQHNLNTGLLLKIQNYIINMKKNFISKSTKLIINKFQFWIKNYELIGIQH